MAGRTIAVMLRRTKVGDMGAPAPDNADFVGIKTARGNEDRLARRFLAARAGGGHRPRPGTQGKPLRQFAPVMIPERHTLKQHGNGGGPAPPEFIEARRTAGASRAKNAPAGKKPVRRNFVASTSLLIASGSAVTMT